VANQTINVASPRSMVNFHGASVVFSFVVTFKKENHNACNGHGWLKTGTVTSICQCAIDRAKRELARVGRNAFESASRRMFPPVDVSEQARALLKK
jgi:hypothetical protein